MSRPRIIYIKHLVGRRIRRIIKTYNKIGKIRYIKLQLEQKRRCNIAPERVCGQTCTSHFIVLPLSTIEAKWHAVVKHEQNVGKPSFHKLTVKITNEDTLWTVLRSAICVHCRFFSQLGRVAQTKPA